MLISLGSEHTLKGVKSSFMFIYISELFNDIFHV